MVYTIEASAHENVLLLPAEYADANYHTIIFNDKTMGEAQIWPSKRGVKAFYYQIQPYDSLVDRLPKSYEIYYVIFSPVIKPTIFDMSIIWDWKSAKYITINDFDGYFAYYLWDNEPYLKELKKLQELSLTVVHGSKEIKIEPFMVEIQSLQTLKLSMALLGDEEIDQFLGNQRGPAPIHMGNNLYAYKRPAKRN